jgi:hypothetical protein
LAEMNERHQGLNELSKKAFSIDKLINENLSIFQ